MLQPYSKRVIATLSKAFRQASEAEEVKEVLKRLSYPYDIKESEELIQIIKKDYELNGKLFKELGIGINRKINGGGVLLSYYKLILEGWTPNEEYGPIVGLFLVVVGLELLISSLKYGFGTLTSQVRVSLLSLPARF